MRTSNYKNQQAENTARSWRDPNVRKRRSENIGKAKREQAKSSRKAQVLSAIVDSKNGLTHAQLRSAFALTRLQVNADLQSLVSSGLIEKIGPYHGAVFRALHT